MASHFDCIGLTVETRDAFEAMISSALERASWTATPDGGQLALWTDPSGALVSISLNADGAIECATPSFAATSRIRVRPLRIEADADCSFCDLLHVEVLGEDETMFYPLALQVDDLGISRDGIAIGSVQTMRVAAFAEEISVWPNDDDYLAAQTSGMTMAPESLFPTGLFEAQAQAQMVLTGHVRAAERRVNETTDSPFYWLAVQTLGGTYDVVVAAADLDEAPPSGAVVQASCWIVGRVLS
jgi:hypothetical protein